MNKKVIGLAIGLVVCLTILIIFSNLIANSGGEALAVDASVRDFFYSIRGEEKGFGFWVLRIITELGHTYYIVFLIVLALIVTKGDNRFMSLTLGIVITILVNMAFKDIFQRERPYAELQWVTEKDTSFPSGHSTFSMFLAVYGAYYFKNSNHKDFIKIIGYVVSGVAMIFVPISRLYFGVHYFSDVIAGMALGGLFAILTVLFNMMLKKYGIFETPILVSIYNIFKNRKQKNNDEIVIEDNTSDDKLETEDKIGDKEE